MLDRNISKIIRKDFQIGSDEIEYTKAKEQYCLKEFDLEQIRYRELEFIVNSSIKDEYYKKKGCIVEKLYSPIYSEEYRIRTYTVLINDLKRIIRLKNMNNDIKKEYEEKIYNLKNIINSLRNITLQNENINLKSKLQEVQKKEEEQECSKSSHQHWIDTILVCFQYAFEIAEKGKKYSLQKPIFLKNKMKMV